ncbi:2-amino-4-hydroxy-6-hydroxymethyldihydropteridine diphosphokinase [Isoptericola jiangsuensis]|uniref:2-amino-4-hydroxy-6- hydroxymethyldihydropteridine diphosphokinase n=1 Tax=Isoptericola jiangsuensis TaxID=548579 RepID=UPI003AAE8431
MTYADTVPGPDGRPLDQIRLTGVRALGHHGVLPQERADGQTFVADVVLHLDTRAAATSDDLARTVSYAEVAEDVHAVLAGEPVDLVETLVERIAAVVLDRPAVQAVDVRVHKPQAPIEVPFDDVEIVVRRDRVNLPAVASPAAGVPAALLTPEPADVPAPHDVPAPPVPVADAFAAQAHGTDEADADPGEVREPLEHVEDAVEPTPLDPLDEAPSSPVGAVLALGANVGDPQGTLRAAVTDIDRIPGVQVMEVSPLARTVAVGPEQPDFLNAVLLVRTTLPPRDLLGACQEVELLHGRVRDERWGPRTLDIDVITYGDLTSTAEDLELPHPRARERAFVLVPWAELDPEAVLGGLGGGPVSQLAATAPDRGGIRWLALDWLTEPASTGAVQVQAAPDVAPQDVAPQDDAPHDAGAPGFEPQDVEPHDVEEPGHAEQAPSEHAPFEHAPSGPVPVAPEPAAYPPSVDPTSDDARRERPVTDQAPAVPAPTDGPFGAPGSLPPAPHAALPADPDLPPAGSSLPGAEPQAHVVPPAPWAYEPVETISAPQPAAPSALPLPPPEPSQVVPPQPVAQHPAAQHPVAQQPAAPHQTSAGPSTGEAPWATPAQGFYQPEVRVYEPSPAVSQAPAARPAPEASAPEPYEPTAYEPTAYEPTSYEPTAYQPTAYQPTAHPPETRGSVPHADPDVYPPEREGPPAYVPQPLSGPHQVAPGFVQPGFVQPADPPSPFHPDRYSDDPDRRTPGHG